jgi:chromosome segregation ATPase
MEALIKASREKDQVIHQLEEFKLLYQRAQEHVHEQQLELAQLKREAFDETQSLYLQSDTLKSSLKEAVEKNQVQLQIIKELEEEKSAYSALLDGMREEIASLNESLEQAQQLTRDSEARLQLLQKDKIDFLDQLERSRHQLLATKEELRSKDDQINDLQASRQRHMQQLNSMEQQVSDAQRQQCLMQTALNDLRRDRETLQRAKAGLEADVKRLQQERLESEAKLQLALEDKSKRAAELQHEQRMRKEREAELEAQRQVANEAHFEQQRTQEALLLANNQIQKFSSDMEKKEQHIEEITQQLVRTRQDKEQIEDELARTKRSFEGRESELQAAQQHLAKKVKESARLTEKLEETAQKIYDIENSNEDLRKRLAIAEAEAEKYRKREKDIEDRSQQKVAEAQAATSRWESEYARVFAQWQQSEEACKKLRSMETKYKQMSVVLAGLLDTPATPADVSFPSSASLPVEAPPPPPPRNDEPNLFQEQTAPKRMKRNLFDP